MPMGLMMMVMVPLIVLIQIAKMIQAVLAPQKIPAMMGLIMMEMEMLTVMMLIV